MQLSLTNGRKLPSCLWLLWRMRKGKRAWAEYRQSSLFVQGRESQSAQLLTSIVHPNEPYKTH